MKPILTSLILLLTAGLFPQAAATQELSKELRSQIGDFLNETARKEISVGKIHIDSVNTEGNDLILFANINCSYIPFRHQSITPSRASKTQVTDPDRPPCHRRANSSGTSQYKREKNSDI